MSSLTEIEVVNLLNSIKEILYENNFASLELEIVPIDFNIKTLDSIIQVFFTNQKVTDYLLNRLPSSEKPKKMKVAKKKKKTRRNKRIFI